MAAAIGIAKTATEIFLGVGEISIDNLTFKLFYKWSVTLFIVSSILVSTSQFFGEPIQCETAEDSVDDDVLNSFCWMYSSFDIPAAFDGLCVRKSNVDGQSKLYNSYYQWISIFLGSMAVLFYIPRCIWIMMEGGLMAYLVKVCPHSEMWVIAMWMPKTTSLAFSFVLSNSPPSSNMTKWKTNMITMTAFALLGTTGRVVDDAEEKMGRMLRLFQEHVHNKFNRYAFTFFACEFTNMCIAVCSILATHRFLNYQFLDYGVQVYRYFNVPPEERERGGFFNPMCEVFPKQVGCFYNRYGTGGGYDSRNAMCILGLNMINDKVFLLIWIWLFSLVLLGIIRISTRSAQLLSSKVRFFLMKMKMYRYFKKNAHIKHIQHYIHNCSIGDWFVLYQMSKNINKHYFARFMALLAMTVDPDPSIEPDDPEILLTPEYIDKIQSASAASSSTSNSDKKRASDSSSDSESHSESHSDSDSDSGNAHKKTFLDNIDAEAEAADSGGGGGGAGLTGKQRALIKLGKHAKSANKKALMAHAAMKRMGRK